MARSTSPSAPTPTFAPIGSRSPSGGLSDACEGYTRPATASMLSRRSARKRREGIGGRPGRVLEVGLGVGERDERGLELRGRQEHAALAHRVEVAGVARGVGPLRRRVVGDRAVAEKRGEHRADAVDRERDARLPGALSEPALEQGAACVERRVHVGPAQLPAGRPARRRGSGATPPMSPAPGSTTPRAISSPRARKSAGAAWRSLNGAVGVSAASGGGTPAESGIEKVAPPDPAFTRRLSAWPW